MDTAALDASTVEQRLLAAVPRVHSIAVEDVSDGHTSTEAALASGRSQRAGGLEFKITIASETFEGLSLLERQRAIYDALRPELESGEIHSLPLMRVWTPKQLAECKQRGEDSRCTALLAQSLSGKEREAARQATREAAASANELAAMEAELRRTQSEILSRTPPSSPSAKTLLPSSSSTKSASLLAETPCECGEATVAQPVAMHAAAEARTQPARGPPSESALGLRKLTDKLQRQIATDTCACIHLLLGISSFNCNTDILCGAEVH